MSEVINDVVQAPESSPASSPAASPAPEVAPKTETPSASPDASPSDPSQPAAAIAGAVPAAPAYTPDFKYKAFGKEYEIPEVFKGLIKDEKLEKEFKSLFSKAQAFEPISQQKKETAERLNTVMGSISKPLAFLQKQDYESFIKSVNIPDEAILEQAFKILQYRDMPADQRAAYDSQMQNRTRVYDLETQNQHLQEQYLQAAVQTRTSELDTRIQSPGVKEIAEAYDAKMGKPGAFKSKVIDYGAIIHATQGQDLSVDQALEAVRNEFAPFITLAQQAPQGLPTVPAGVVQAANRPAVIPNIGTGHQSSPVKKVFKSIDDIRKYARERQAAQN